MRKIIFTILFVLFLMIPAFAIELPDGVNDANTLQIHMRQNFYWADDRVIPNYFEYFQIPMVLEFTRIGDCDDMATYSWFYLANMGYDTQRFILILKIDEEYMGHAITVFLDSDKTFSIFSNQYIFKTAHTNFLDAIKDVFPDWYLIATWNPTKYGYLTSKEVYGDTILINARTLEGRIKWMIDFIKKSKLK